VLLGDLASAAGLRLDDLVLTPSTAVALLASISPTAACPRCGTPSDRIHSRCRRTVADLPCQDRPVALRLVVRKFRCADAACPQRIFCERLPRLIAAHARSTARLTEAHRAIGFALGGEAGARLADRLDMPTSADTLLRRVKGAADGPAPPPRYVGVNDWAIRKGQRYGTILIDLERGRVIDILPGRDGEALKDWLKLHPGVEVITRDRWPAYAQAAAEAAPQARQVADRWHLLKNLREAVQRLLERHSADARLALKGAPEAPAAADALRRADRAAAGWSGCGLMPPSRGNPPILHRKESFLHAEHELHRKFARLTKQEEKAGLFEETATIGTREGWHARLAEKGYALRGHRLVKAAQHNGDGRAD
jgi:hypothetical protein